MRRFDSALVLALGALGMLVGGCGEKEFAYDTNLLENPSFEEVGEDGIPKGWELRMYRGLPEESEVRYRVDESVAQHGDKSWQFIADMGTRRWYMLTQEVEVPEVTHVRLTGWMKTDRVGLWPDQYPLCNFLITYYDENHARFQDYRAADKRTLERRGTRLWSKEDQTFRVPRGTRYIAVSCILAMDGRAWFDDVSLSIPEPIDWQSTETKNFVYHWLRGNPPPEGAVASQQEIFDAFAERLGISESDVVINYYFYPDTTAIRDILSLQGYHYVSWDDQEFHSINPNDNHEVVHFITQPYGEPPKSIAEGTVYWLWGEWDGRPIRPLAALLLAHDLIVPLESLANYNNFAILDPRVALPTAAAFVDYLVTRYGAKKLLQFYEELDGVNSYPLFAVALEKVYGVPADQIEEEYHAALSVVDYTEVEKQGLPRIGKP
jgi:hypothetical protein